MRHALLAMERWVCAWRVHGVSWKNWFMSEIEKHCITRVACVKLSKCECLFMHVLDMCAYVNMLCLWVYIFKSVSEYILYLVSLCDRSLICLTTWTCKYDSSSMLGIKTCDYLYIYMKSLVPKGARSIFDQIWVTTITTLFILPLTFKTHFWSECN